MSARRVTISYADYYMVDIIRWLNLNKYEFTIIANSHSAMDADFEVYTDEAEVAIRLKWKTK